MDPSLGIRIEDGAVCWVLWNEKMRINRYCILHLTLCLCYEFFSLFSSQFMYSYTYCTYNTCCWVWLAKDRQLALRMEWCASELRRVSKAIKPASDFSAQIVVSVLSSQHSSSISVYFVFVIGLLCAKQHRKLLWTLRFMVFVVVVQDNRGGRWWWVGVVGVDLVDLVLLQICIHYAVS